MLILMRIGVCCDLLVCYDTSDIMQELLAAVQNGEFNLFNSNSSAIIGEYTFFQAIISLAYLIASSADFNDEPR